MPYGDLSQPEAQFDIHASAYRKAEALKDVE